MGHGFMIWNCCGFSKWAHWFLLTLAAVADDRADGTSGTGIRCFLAAVSVLVGWLQYFGEPFLDYG